MGDDSDDDFVPDPRARRASHSVALALVSKAPPQQRPRKRQRKTSTADKENAVRGSEGGARGKQAGRSAGPAAAQGRSGGTGAPQNRSTAPALARQPSTPALHQRPEPPPPLPPHAVAHHSPYPPNSAACRAAQVLLPQPISRHSTVLQPQSSLSPEPAPAGVGQARPAAAPHVRPAPEQRCPVCGCNLYAAALPSCLCPALRSAFASHAPRWLAPRLSPLAMSPLALTGNAGGCNGGGHMHT